MVARFLGVEEVVGSNPVVPTILGFKGRCDKMLSHFATPPFCRFIAEKDCILRIELDRKK